MNRDRHVGFEDSGSEVEEEEEGIPDHEGKLRRRDTPHHLKNKRITLGSSKEEAEEKVRAILAQAQAPSKEASPSPVSVTSLCYLGHP